MTSLNHRQPRGEIESKMISGLEGYLLLLLLPLVRWCWWSKSQTRVKMKWRGRKISWMGKWKGNHVNWFFLLSHTHINQKWSNHIPVVPTVSVKEGERKNCSICQILWKRGPVGRLSELPVWGFSWRKMKMYVTTRNVCERREECFRVWYYNPGGNESGPSLPFPPLLPYCLAVAESVCFFLFFL